MRKPFKPCYFRSNHGVRCERELGHRGRHSYDLFAGGCYRWSGGLIPVAVAHLVRHKGKGAK